MLRNRKSNWFELLSKNNNNGSRLFTVKRVLIAFVIFIIFMTILSSFYTVKSGTRKLVLTAGEATSVSSEGLNFKIPFYQQTKEVNIKTLQATQAARAASKDLQIVSSTISVNYHFNSEKLLETYSNTGFEIQESIISPRIQETLKAVAAKYSAEQLITQREKAKADIDTILKKDLAKYNIIVEDVQLTEFNFSEGFNDAIEAKQTEEQNTQKSRNVLERIKVEAEQRVTQAKGEAEAIKIQSEAITSNGGMAYVELKKIEKWDGKLPTYMAGSESNAMISIK